jgi:Xaa-Pro aminopeptidase
MDELSPAITKGGSDAYVVYASSRDPDMRYLAQFTSSDPYVFIKKPGRKATIIVSQMETVRASRESDAAVISRTQAGLPEILKTEKDLTRATAKMIAGQAGKRILVPPTFPLALAEALGKHCKVTADKGTVASMRAKKKPGELKILKNLQIITEGAMEIAVGMIRKSKVKKGDLFLNNAPLTSEKIRLAMHTYLLERECSATDTIVSCGEDAAIPHMAGTGPLHANEPIVIDIFPFQEKTGYYADMTRTVSKGAPSKDIDDMYIAVRDAKQQAIRKMRPGVSGADVYQSVVDFFHERGYESNTKGFVHSLGHGIGLQVHEAPSVGPGGGLLEPGNVVTVEPGLYYPGIGGVRLEDMGVVTKKGFSIFTKFPEELIL